MEAARKWAITADCVGQWFDESLKAMQDAHAAGDIWTLRALVKDAEDAARGYWVPTYTIGVEQPTGRVRMQSPVPNMMAELAEQGWKLIGTCDPRRFTPTQSTPVDPIEYDQAEAWAAQRYAASLDPKLASRS